MQNLRTLPAAELAQKLLDLTSSAQSSGRLTPLVSALTPYTGRGDAQLDKRIRAFDAAREDYVYRVVRGYAGVMEWRRVVKVAKALAQSLNAVQE